jgi:hypothetical protein
MANKDLKKDSVMYFNDNTCPFRYEGDPHTLLANKALITRSEKLAPYYKKQEIPKKA